MTRARIALLLGLAAIAWTGRAAAQDMEFGLEESETAGQEGTEGTGEAGAEGTGEAGAEGGEGDVIGDLAAPETGQQAAQGERAPRRTEAVEEIYAVQQIYALRNGRVELSPSIAFTVNDPYVSHPSGGLGINYWWTNVLAVGINFLWYQGLENESDLNFFVRRSTRLAVPITEYQLGAHLNFTYVPLYGKFAMFNEYIFQWDAYIVGGVGMLRTRPVPVVDPEIRQFDFDLRVAFNVGIGLRVFVTRWLAFFAELRDYAYLERLENLQVGLGEARIDSATWLDDSASLTNNVTVHIGLTLFFPFGFEYELPR
jgi:outer membrane beta-barrel protein